MKNRKHAIENTLHTQLPLHYLEVIDESFRHHVPDNAQTHFKVIVVSSHFDHLSLLERHRIINELLKDEFNNGLHALSIHAYTPTTWLEQKDKINTSPACKDGFDK